MSRSKDELIPFAFGTLAFPSDKMVSDEIVGLFDVDGVRFSGSGALLSAHCKELGTLWADMTDDPLTGFK